MLAVKAREYAYTIGWLSLEIKLASKTGQELEGKNIWRLSMVNPQCY